MKRRAGPRLPRGGFTLLELLVVMAIIALLAQLLVPVTRVAMQKAQSAACASNLRQIGVAVIHATQDRDGRYPRIETDPSNPVYPDLPDEEQPKSLLETLAPYGIEEIHLKCPADLKNNNRFASMGSSYEWRPFIDDEPSANPQVYFRDWARTVRPSRFRIVMDVDPVHKGRQNRLYADGHVVSY